MQFQAFRFGLALSADPVRHRHLNLPPVLWRFAGAAVLGLWPLAMSGCGGSDLPDGIPVSGTVKYNGEPLDSGEVVYTPIEPEGRAARGRIQNGGSFQMTTSVSIPGVLPGKYSVSVVPVDEITAPPRGPSADPVVRPEGRETVQQTKPPFPARYFRGETSGLEDVVDENHPGTITLELTD